VKLETYTQADAFEQLRPEWNALLHRSAVDNVFSSWEYQSTWWEVFQPGRLLIVTCRDDNGQLIGIAPWFICGGDVIRGIGCEDITDYLDVIADATYVESVLECFVSYLAERRDDYRRIELCNIPEESPTYRLLRDTFERCGFTATIEQQEVCPVIELPESWEDYLAQLDKKQRHEIRRKLRRATGDDEHEVDWYIVDGSRVLDDEIETFLRLMAASDPQKAEFLSDERNERFFRRLIPLMFKQGWLQLVFLTVNGQAAATYFNFDYNKRILVYNSGLDPEAYGHLSAGIVLLALTIRHAIENGYKAFDFLRGDENYKYRMGGKDTGVYKLIAELQPSN
jgi:CelD/BcsL family acetyltransferase involved in cellulose biosynthesis